jgi:hypothetical protein
MTLVEDYIIAPILITNSIQEKAMEATKQTEKRGKNPSPRNRKACHSVSTRALLKIIAPIPFLFLFQSQFFPYFCSEGLSPLL